MTETIMGYMIWIALAGGYVAMLALTERSAARFVAAPRPVRESSAIVVVATASNPEPQPVAQTRPAVARTALS